MQTSAWKMHQIIAMVLHSQLVPYRAMPHAIMPQFNYEKTNRKVSE